MSTEEWRRMHRGYAETHARVPSETFLTVLDERNELEAEANRIATLLSQVGGDRRKLDQQLAARQMAVEILGSAIAEVLPGFRASGSPTEYVRKVAAALVARVDDLRALLSVQDANHGACIERCEQLETEVEQLRERIAYPSGADLRCKELEAEVELLIQPVEDARRDYFEAGGLPSQIDRSHNPEWYRRRTVKLLRHQAEHHRESLRRVAIVTSVLKGVEEMGHPKAQEILHEREPQLFTDSSSASSQAGVSASGDLPR